MGASTNTVSTVKTVWVTMTSAQDHTQGEWGKQDKFKLICLFFSQVPYSQYLTFQPEPLDKDGAAVAGTALAGDGTETAPPGDSIGTAPPGDGIGIGPPTKVTFN